jgi:hypothetical protein
MVARLCVYVPQAAPVIGKLCTGARGSKAAAGSSDTMTERAEIKFDHECVRHT